MAATHPAAWLLIVGDGPLRPALEQEARERGVADRVVFTGYYDDIPGALRAMDVFTLPSILEEGFPTAVLEAEAMGVPVVATDKGGTFETMDVGETGLLVPIADAAALAEALTSLHDDPERRRRMGATAFAFIRSRFSLEDMVARVGATYDEALAEYGQRQ
jgi:glycosyltransferase involved in cell wall biosynthesis